MNSNNFCDKPQSIKCVLLLLLIGISLVRAYQPNSANMKFAAIMNRHGDRTPTKSYPTDPYRDYPWSVGWGALTTNGSRQLYDMGTCLRRRLKQLLPADGMYSQNNMQALSSHLQRCVMSGQSLLAGLMPPNRDLNQLPIYWQPAAVMGIPKNSDIWIYQAGVRCTAFDEAYENLLTGKDNRTDFYKYNRELTPLFAYLTKCTGESITDVSQVGDLHDILTVESMNGMKLPEWTKPVFPQILYDVRVRAYKLYTETPCMTRFRGGPLISDITKQMVSKCAGDLNRNFAMYSGHDTTLNFVMKALNVIDQTTEIPDYGATLCCEMYRHDDDDDCEVNWVYYSNTTVCDPVQLIIPDCPPPCYLSRFIAITQHIQVNDFAEYTKLCESEIC